MTHNHSHESVNYNRAFIISVSLNTLFVVVEAVYGILANSLALLADAGHNLSDVLGLLLAWGASLLSQRLPSARRTFGLRRSSILAALLNATFLLLVSGGIGWEAMQRFVAPTPVAGATVINVAAIGIAINTGSALMFLSGRKQDLNLRGAFLHLVADAAVSVGVVLAGIVIVLTGWLWLDPAVSLVVTVAIVAGTWQLFRESLDLMMDAVPAGIEPLAIRTYLAELPGVVGVHDLHIWGMSTTETALMAHLIIPNEQTGDAFLSRASQGLHNHFGIEHTTLQIETGDPAYPCPQAPDDRV
ncbi:cation diffusion facilitator family transporter [Pseudanabaena sp. PCC 6802]|uniref:cation diffusion facilitator family transporter n=1 Tax=Pseudanabaena sp. PCC 6802 TaxID=118173 RepID=UPI00034BD2CE|nr:cation diffusion facilitator family transporter [Pseudanabaena sp. PCC 6802]